MQRERERRQRRMASEDLSKQSSFQRISADSSCSTCATDDAANRTSSQQGDGLLKLPSKVFPMPPGLSLAPKLHSAQSEARRWSDPPLAPCPPVCARKSFIEVLILLARLNWNFLISQVLTKPSRRF